jgi:hypothetical protein
MNADERQVEMGRRMEALIERSAAGLRAAGDDWAAIIAVIRPFLDEGMEITGSPSALWDHFGTALRRAKFDAAQRDRRFRIFSTVTQERFQGGRPYPPDWPWHEQDPA